MKLQVLKPFKDKLNLKKTYKAGDTLVTEDLGRINDLVARGFCVIASIEDASESNSEMVTLKGKKFPLADVKAALESIDIQIAANAKAKNVSKVVDMLTEEQVSNLSAVLSKEEPETEGAETSDKGLEAEPKEE